MIPLYTSLRRFAPVILKVGRYGPVAFTGAMVSSRRGIIGGPSVSVSLRALDLSDVVVGDEAPHLTINRCCGRLCSAAKKEKS
jgi:hypothetical protein